MHCTTWPSANALQTAFRVPVKRRNAYRIVAVRLQWSMSVKYGWAGAERWTGLQKETWVEISTVAVLLTFSMVSIWPCVPCSLLSRKRSHWDYQSLVTTYRKLHAGDWRADAPIAEGASPFVVPNVEHKSASMLQNETRPQFLPVCSGLWV